MPNIAMVMKQWMRGANLLVRSGNRTLVTSTTGTRYGTIHHDHAPPPGHGKSTRFRSLAMSPEFAPVWVVVGMVCVAGSIGIHTATQQLCRSPSVQVTKKKRECVPEVDHPDAVLGSADKFINKSFLRKVAHIQDNKYPQDDDSIHHDIFTRSRDIETLKSVGVRTS